MLLLARRIEHPLDVSVLRSHHSNVRMHQWPAIFRRHDQGFGRGLPFRALLFCLG
jgi:hypothetical protein